MDMHRVVDVCCDADEQDGGDEEWPDHSGNRRACKHELEGTCVWVRRLSKGAITNNEGRGSFSGDWEDVLLTVRGRHYVSSLYAQKGEPESNNINQM